MLRVYIALIGFLSVNSVGLAQSNFLAQNEEAIGIGGIIGRTGGSSVRGGWASFCTPDGFELTGQILTGDGSVHGMSIGYILRDTTKTDFERLVAGINFSIALGDEATAFGGGVSLFYTFAFPNHFKIQPAVGISIMRTILKDRFRAVSDFELGSVLGLSLFRRKGSMIPSISIGVLGNTSGSGTSRFITTGVTFVTGVK